MITDEHAEEALHAIHAIVDEIAKAKAERLYLQEFIKAKRALLMKKYAEGSFGMPVAAQEREAMADPEYLEVLRGYCVAIERDVRAHFKQVADMTTIDAWRTMKATERAVKL